MGFDKLLGGILHTVVYTCWCVYAFEAQKSSYWCRTGHPVNRECKSCIIVAELTSFCLLIFIKMFATFDASLLNHNNRTLP